MPPSPQGGGIKGCFCLTSVAYIGRNSRTEALGRLKLAQRHHFQGQKVKGQLVPDVLNSQHAGTGATLQRNTKILLFRNSTATWWINIVNLQGGGITWRPPAYILFCCCRPITVRKWRHELRVLLHKQFARKMCQHFSRCGL